jgi:proliferating cell nuclear antigen
MSTVNRVYLKTVQSNAFKTLVEALKDILTDTNIKFDETGLKIIAMDTSQTVLVHLKLEAKNFEIYECKTKFVIGLSMINFFKLIKTMTNNDTLELSVMESNPNLLNIRYENGEKNTITKYKLNLIDLKEDEIEIPPAHFSSILTMPSSDFQKVCRDMSNLSSTIEIKSIGNSLMFSCVGDFATQETIFGEGSGSLSFTKTTGEEEIIQGYYNLKHLILFTKCTNLCNSIELYMRNNYPLVIKFAVGSLGYLKMCLAPKALDS